MWTLLLELVNVQLPSLLLGVSVVLSSYLCYHFAAPLAFTFLRSSHSSAESRARSPKPSPALSFFSSSPQLLAANMDGIPLDVFSSSSSPSSSPAISSFLSSSASSLSLDSSRSSTLDLSSSSSSPAATTPTTTIITPGKRVSKSKLLRLGSSMSFAVPLALTRRAWKGAAYSTWSVGFEVQHEMGQALIRNHHRFSLTDLCQLSADFAADPPANLSSIRTVYCGGIRADLVQYCSPHRQNQSKASPNMKNSKSGERDAKGKVADRGKKYSHEDGELGSPSNLSKSTPAQSPHPSLQSSSTVDENGARAKVNMRRNKSESDNLGRDYQFKAEAGEDADDDAGTVLYFHGGGFCVGSATTYRKCLWHFSREMKGLRFLAVDYSLSPHARFPTALQECLHAYLWLIDENGGNVPADKVILAGDSAGGCLVLALLFLIRNMRDEAAKSNAGSHRDATDEHSVEKDEDEEEKDEEKEKEDSRTRSSFADGENERTRSENDYDTAKEEGKETKEGKKPKLPFALPSRKTPPAFPLCVFLMSPWVDLSEASSVMKAESYAQQATYQAQMSLARRFINAYLGLDDHDKVGNGKSKSKSKNKKQEMKEIKEMTKNGPDVLSPFISPLYGDMHGLPPVMLTAGSEEPLVADIEALYAKCVDADLEVELDVGEHMNHAYQVFHDPSSHREIERSLQAVSRFVWRHIAKRQMVEAEQGQNH